jgi:hypothetical protein
MHASFWQPPVYWSASAELHFPMSPEACERVVQISAQTHQYIGGSPRLAKRHPCWLSNLVSRKHRSVSDHRQSTSGIRLGDSVSPKQCDEGLATICRNLCEDIGTDTNPQIARQYLVPGQQTVHQRGGHGTKLLCIGSCNRDTCICFGPMLQATPTCSAALGPEAVATAEPR